jgi:hypothetical protein
MKLARPDVFHPRIVLAGGPRHPDDAGLVPALRTRGLHARWLSWDDPETVGADLVILRATASAPNRREEFLAWIRRVRHLLNPPDAVAWKHSHAWPVEPEFESWDLGYAALAAAAEHAGIGAAELLYARAEVTEGRLVRLDLVAPSLGWRLLDADTRDLAQRRFGLAVESACERLGLGPFPQGRP